MTFELCATTLRSIMNLCTAPHHPTGRRVIFVFYPNTAYLAHPPVVSSQLCSGNPALASKGWSTGSLMLAIWTCQWEVIECFFQRRRRSTLNYLQRDYSHLAFIVWLCCFFVRHFCRSLTVSNLQIKFYNKYTLIETTGCIGYALCQGVIKWTNKALTV